MHKSLYVFYFENNGKEDEVEVLAFRYFEAEILAKAEQIHAGRPWHTIKRYRCYDNTLERLRETNSHKIRRLI